MKTWITYAAAIAMGFSASLLLGEFALFDTIVGSVVPVLIDIGVFILFPMVFITFASGISSLRRHSRTSLMFFTTILWSLFTTMVLSAAAAAVFKLLPFTLNDTTAISRFTVLPDGLDKITATRVFSLLFHRNAFMQFFAYDSHLLPIISIAAVIGYALKPNIEVIRPAYVVMNSFSEAMFRIARFFAVFGAITVGFTASSFFRTVDFDGMFYTNLSYFSIIGIATFIALFVILPLLFVLFTGFRRGNPYRVLFGATAACLAGFFTSNQLWATTVLLPTARKNNQIQKRIAGTTLPLYTILGKGGSAMMATVTLLVLITMATKKVPSWTEAMVAAAFCSIFSLLSSFNLGYGTLAILLMACSAMSIDLQSLNLMVLALLPIIGGAATMIDTAIAAFGSAYSSRLIVTGMKTPYRELI